MLSPKRNFYEAAKGLNPDRYANQYEALRLILLVVVGVSVLYSTLLCFVPEIGWYSDVYGWAYQNVIESFEFWT